MPPAVITSTAQLLRFMKGAIVMRYILRGCDLVQSHVDLDRRCVTEITKRGRPEAIVGAANGNGLPFA